MCSKQKSGASAMTYKIYFFALLFVANQRESHAFGQLSKENIFADVLLTELLNRMDKDVDHMNNYFEDDDILPKSVDILSRSSKNNAADDYEYRRMFGGSVHPSIRDQEYLQHSSLWGHQYVSGGMGEVPNRYNTIVKTDATLPAYCNPPNPCPYGYEDSQGCITDFENTAIFSREYQAAQICTCDSEHMFDCGAEEDNANNNEMTTNMEKFLMHQFQNENDIDTSNAVVKKFYGFAGGNQLENNPFLSGEKLPIAAKKGDHIHV